MKKIRVAFAFFLFALAPLTVRAGGDEVVVIYNARLPESKAVAEHYAEVRHVPAGQIYSFALTTNEVMSRAEFRDALQMPFAHKLEADRLWQFGAVAVPATNGQPRHIEQRVIAAKIRYAVLCYGVPLKIAEDPDLHEPLREGMRQEWLRNEAAVDSELAWLPQVKLGVRLNGPLPNWVYGVTNAFQLNPTNGVLLVARLDGPSANIARGLVDKALQAERDGLWGRAYFDTRGLPKTDTNYYLGDQWMLESAEFCRRFGFETVVDKNPETFPASFPMSQIAIYCGWYTGDADGPFTLPRVEFMPGAFAYHLHSFSAATLRSPTENWCGPLLAKGATCTLGCVNEPYLSATPNVAAFLARLIGGRFTFGEAAWASQPVLSWQTTVVGDPLYCPFGTPPQVMHEDLARSHNPLIEWSYLRLLNLYRVRGVPLGQLAGFLENLDVAPHSAVLTEKLADIYELQGKPMSAIETYQRVLSLNPTPEQRIRLELTLGEKLAAEDRNIEAIVDYKQLLKESPGYPGRTSVEAKLAALQQKLVKFNATAKP